MSKKNNNPNAEYLVIGNDGLMDISSGTPVAAEGYQDGFASGNGGDFNPNGKKKKIIIISAVAAAVVVVALQLWKRNPLVSILAGTAVYMALVQTVVP